VKTSNREYEFSVHINGFDWSDEAVISKLVGDQFALVPFASEGLSMFRVATSAMTAEQALKGLRLFLNDQLPQIRIIRIDPELVSLSQISEQIDVTREAVRLWARGERREGFPTPYTSSGQSLLWAWSQIFDWLSDEEVRGLARPLPIDLIERTNGIYARERMTTELGWPLRQTQRTQRYSGQLGTSKMGISPRSLHGTMKYGPALSLTLEDKEAL
jgi:hypothetical protein